MPEIDCPYHEMHEGRIKKLEKRCDGMEDKMHEMDKASAVKVTEIMGILDTLSTLPKTMSDISNTMLSMQREIAKSNSKIDSSNDKIDRLEQNVSSLKSKVEKVDEEGKFNIRTFLNQHWIGIVIGLGGLIYAYIK